MKENIANLDDITISTCNTCRKYHLWCNAKVLISTNSTIFMQLEDVLQVIKDIYLELRDVYPISLK